MRVFVSHHHSDEEDRFTARLVTDLERAGADVWVDTKGITSGNFIRKMNEGLAGRHWLLLVMSPAALRSEWVQEEVDAALHQVKGKHMLGVIPIVMLPCDEALIPPVWATLHRYDATKRYESARDGLLRAMGLPQLAPEQSQPPNTPPVFFAPASPGPTPAPWLPEWLAQRGFTARKDGAVEYILPPICDVPTGSFLMGSDRRKDSHASGDELPQHMVLLNVFQIGKHPVTVAEYACFVRAGHRDREPSQWQTQLGRLHHPVDYVSWDDAIAYAKWLTDCSGQPWRLPSEAEWEKAARGTDGRIYPWDDTFDISCANTKEGKKGNTTPVGSYPSGVSPYGAMDMAGNVWEWTSSIYKPYPYNASDGRERAEPTKNHVLRGGEWNSSAQRARVACRDHRRSLNPDFGGFRLAVALIS